MQNFELNNGVTIPMLGLGTFQMSPDQAQKAVVSALESGYRLLDTANAYLNEKAVGRGIRESSVTRQEIFLSSKLWPTVYQDKSDRDLKFSWQKVDTIIGTSKNKTTGDPS